MVNAQVFALFPALEQAPDHTASRPLDTLSVTFVFAPNDADPVLPTVTLIPVGVDTTRSPLRPLAVTVSVTPCAGGGGGGDDAALTVSAANWNVPPRLAAS
jgi:hypothetical protein